MIEFWLKDWFLKNANIPLEIVTNMSKPLQNAICLATNNITYNQYLLMCYRFLINKTKVLIKPYLRIDIAHFIHWISRLRCFANVNAAVKDFYLRAFGLMTTAENLEVLEKLMRAVLKISQNNYNFTDDIRWVLDKIKTFEFDDSINYKNLKTSTPCEEKNFCDDHLSCHEEFIKMDDIEYLLKEPNELDDYIETLVIETCIDNPSNTSINYSNINSYYCPAILPSLKIIFKKFPSWSNVMKSPYGCKNLVPTSARSENYFNFIKNTQLENHQPVRVDKFLVKHLRSIFSKIKEARAALEQLKMEEKQLKVKKDKKQNKTNIDSIFKLQENWRNQVQPISLGSEESDTSLTKQDDNSNHISLDKPVQISEDLNKNLNDDLLEPVQRLDADLNLIFDKDEVPKPVFVSTPIKVESKIIDEELTDLINPKYSLPSSVNDTNFSLEKNSDENFSIKLESKQPSFHLKCSKIAKKRKAKVTYKSSPESKREENCSINCRDDISRTFTWIMNESNCNTEQTYCTNNKCNYLKSVKAPVLNVSAKLVWKNGLHSLEQCICNEVRKKDLYLCDSCKILSAKKQTTVTSYLCLNIEHFYEPTISFTNSGLKQRTGYYLEEIPHRLKVFEMSFLLSGVIEFVPAEDPLSIPHYIAYTRSINNVWTQINDMQQKSQKFAPKLREVKAFLLFYVLI
ncbi:unnamed protein product [Euphydryas editha]|uniref:Uncharacterized protein n=1 Tax=Euphydryas editha TaxID=104508 RepID=A0AAU9VD29_EUPED|nr:unnamed protein product [Euphydryas editha]